MLTPSDHILPLVRMKGGCNSCRPVQANAFQGYSKKYERKMQLHVRQPAYSEPSYVSLEGNSCMFQERSSPPNNPTSLTNNKTQFTGYLHGNNFFFSGNVVTFGIRHGSSTTNRQKYRYLQPAVTGNSIQASGLQTP